MVGTSDIFSAFEKIATLAKQKEKLQQLVDGLEEFPKELLATNSLLGSALTSSCKWVR